MRHARLAAILLTLLTAALPAGVRAENARVVTRPATIVTDGVPPIPLSIEKRMKPYADVGFALCRGWRADGRGMIIAGRPGNTTQLFSLDRPGGQLHPLTNTPEPVSTAVVCPDPARHYLVFSKDVGGGENYQYFRYDLADGTARMITDGTSRHMGMLFDHDGRQMAYADNSRTGNRFDVYVMDPQKPEAARCVLKARRSAYYLPTGWLADNRHLIVVEYVSANVTSTLVVDTVGGEMTDYTPPADVPQVFSMVFASPDGRYLFGLSDRGSEFQRLVRYDRRTADIRVLTADIPWNVEDVALSPDGKTFAFTASADGFETLYLGRLDTLACRPVRQVPRGLISGLEFDGRSRHLAMNLNNARMNGSAYALDLESGVLTCWAEGDTAGLDLAAFVEPELIHYPTFDRVDGRARQIPALYFRPPSKFKPPYPVMISFHGGPEGQYPPFFQGTYNYLINEMGIAIIAPNVRGSAGYGKSYLLLDNAEKREDSVRDVGALLDWIATRPELDQSRVAVYGGSYGGYMVLASLVHYSDRLVAGVDVVGISNFVTFLRNTSAYRRDLRRAEYGDERKIGDFLREISPATHADRIRVPLFVIQGQNDPRVPRSESEQIVKTVRRNGVPVWYMVGTNEGHGFSKKDNRSYMDYAVTLFWEKYLLKK